MKNKNLNKQTFYDVYKTNLDNECLLEGLKCILKWNEWHVFNEYFNAIPFNKTAIKNKILYILENKTCSYRLKCDFDLKFKIEIYNFIFRLNNLLNLEINEKDLKNEDLIEYYKYYKNSPADYLKINFEGSIFSICCLFKIPEYQTDDMINVFIEIFKKQGVNEAHYTDGKFFLEFLKNYVDEYDFLKSDTLLNFIFNLDWFNYCSLDEKFNLLERCSFLKNNKIFIEKLMLEYNLKNLKQSFKYDWKKDYLIDKFHLTDKVLSV